MTCLARAKMLTAHGEEGHTDNCLKFIMSSLN
jgi:hypothetical protein